MNTLVALLCCAGSALAAAAEAPAPTGLSLRAMQQWTLVTAEDATPSEKYAADEFRALFKLVTGVEAPTASKAPGPHGAIFIGPGAAMKAHSMGFDTAALGEEGVRIRISADTLIIAGGRPRGTLYGVYEFFERFLGVRFLTYDHTYVPEKAADTGLFSTDYTYVPPLSFRWSYYQENSDKPEFSVRLRNNTVAKEDRLGGASSQTLISHSLASLLPPAQFGKDHPEYYALVGGVRKITNEGGGPQVCVTNPEVIERVAESVNKELDAHPEMKNISVSQMDNSDYCECPVCAEFTKREGTPMGPHMAFVNAVAERVEKKHPRVMIGTLAYDYTRKPPKTVSARDNVEIQLCSIECCTAHSIDDPSCVANREFCADLQGWKTKCKSIWMWNYNTNFRNYDLPFPNLKVIAKNIQFFVDNGVRGVFMQAAGNALSSEMSDLRNYVMSRCLWRPSEESWPLVEEFCRLHYAESAEPILAYERFLHDNASLRGVHPGCFPVEGEVGLDADVARRIQPYFADALRLAKSDAVLARVEKASIPALKAMITLTPMAYKDGVYGIDTAALGDAVIDRYVALCKKNRLNRTAETTTMESYLEDLAKLRKGTPAVLLENAVWRVVVVPEMSGRIVELTPKATGRNLVEGLTRGFSRRRSHEEWIRGERPDATIPQTFTWETGPRSVTLTRKLDDGGSLRRTIALASDTADAVSFETEVTSGAGLTFESLVHPEYTTVSSSEDPNIIAVYAKTPNWTHVNKDWRWEAGAKPDRPMAAATGGAFAYYNNAEHFGVMQTFKPESFQRQTVFWSPGRRQLNLQMFTPMTTLAPGKKLVYGYEVRYLDKPPLEPAK